MWRVLFSLSLLLLLLLCYPRKLITAVDDDISTLSNIYESSIRIFFISYCLVDWVKLTPKSAKIQALVSISFSIYFLSNHHHHRSNNHFIYELVSVLIKRFSLHIPLCSAQHVHYIVLLSWALQTNEERQKRDDQSEVKMMMTTWNVEKEDETKIIKCRVELYARPLNLYQKREFCINYIQWNRTTT